jgi:hypothetical protein
MKVGNSVAADIPQKSWETLTTTVWGALNDAGGVTPPPKGRRDPGTLRLIFHLKIDECEPGKWTGKSYLCQPRYLEERVRVSILSLTLVSTTGRGLILKHILLYSARMGMGWGCSLESDAPANNNT